MKSVTGIIFDLDGTLLDTLEDIASSANRVLLEHGFNAHETESYKLFVGSGVRVLMQRCSQLLAEDPQLDAMVEDFREDYGQNWNANTKPYDGIEDLLQALTQKGLPLAVLSNKPHTFTQKCVEHYFSTIRFDFVKGMRPDKGAKPDPEQALEIAAGWKTEPGQLAFVGDTSVDMQTAKNAAMTAIGVSWGFRNSEELLENGAEYIFNNAAQLLKALS